MTSVSEKNKWKALAFSTLIRFSFHTYQGLLWALVIGVIYGLFYYVMYKKVVKNLCHFSSCMPWQICLARVSCIS